MATVFATTALVCGMSLPQTALATVRVDANELAQGENAVGGGTATLIDSTLDMGGVTAGELFSDEDLLVNFKGGNDIDEFNVAGAAKVEMGFSGENEVEEVHVKDKADVTINADGHNEFEEVDASDQSKLTINVTGENAFEEIVGHDDASVTVRGTDCPQTDVVNLGEDEEDTQLWTERGTLTIDRVTINVEAEEAQIGSEKGDVVIDTAKISGNDDNERISLVASGAMSIRESVIDFVGEIVAKGELLVSHSDIRVVADEDGKGIDVKAEGKAPAYYCVDDAHATAESALPKTADAANLLLPTALASAGVATAALSRRRR